MQKQNKRSVGKRGFTLVELSVVIALLAILATMTVTFTVMMSDVSDDIRSEYEYLEDYSKAKEDISKWLKENDVAGKVFVLIEPVQNFTTKYKKIYVNVGDSVEYVPIDYVKCDSIDDVFFEIVSYGTEDELIKCTITQKDPDRTMSFVYAPRYAGFN